MPNSSTTDPLNYTRRRDVLSVSDLNREARRLLESGFGVLWVEGEISNLARPASGHWYFSLKDDGAQVRCAMFRQRNRLLAFEPADGDQVQLRARVSIYEPRGDYQLKVDFMEPAGEGALRRAFEALKARLDKEGLFALDHKQPLPDLPRRIGLLTSPSGAAVRDILKVLKRRFPAVPVIIYPVPVQGEGAADKIAQMLATAVDRRECDVLILARGGGSLEDLWAFNEEVLARAIFACPLPVISAVGHETDVTIADLVADVRAPTPSAAAELVVPDRSEWLGRLRQLARRAAHGMARRIERASDKEAGLSHRLLRLHPAQVAQEHSQRSDELESRLRNALAGLLRTRRARAAELGAHLQRLSPVHRIERLQAVNAALAQRLATTVKSLLEKLNTRLSVSVATLDAVSPLATLQRGYAILTRDRDQEIVRRADQVKVNETITARLADGQLKTRVVKIPGDESE